MSGAWGKSSIGNWAAEAEAEEREAAAAAAASAPADAKSFPSLKEAVTAKPKKKKMTLSEFYSDGGGATLSAAARLTPDEMMRLPTGPKERSADEMQYGRLGGGFSSYGRDRGPPNRAREDSDGGSWGGGGGGGGGRRSYGGFDDERRGSSPRVSEFDQPSRADEVDNWASAKKTLPSFDSGRQNRYSSLGGGGGGGNGGYGSRADDVDNWAMGKKAVTVPAPARSSAFGSGFRDSGPEPDRWSRGGMREAVQEPERERPRLVLDPRKSDGGVIEPGKVNKSSPFGAARPREEVLADKGLDWKKLESELEAKRPTSSHSSRPSSAQSNRSESQGLHGVENVVKTRAKVNPFGDAKPREVLLEEKGLDWRKIDLDLEHRAIERPETEEEKLLKDEIDDLKKQLAQDPNIHEIVLQKEKELELLVRDLDDKVRFGQKAVDRPGSGAGRAAGFADRPSSRSGSHEESRSNEYVDRPRSRGTGDAWARHGEDRRGFQGGRERGFLGNRDMERPRSRERW